MLQWRIKVDSFCFCSTKNTYLLYKKDVSFYVCFFMRVFMKLNLICKIRQQSQTGNWNIAWGVGVLLHEELGSIASGVGCMLSGDCWCGPEPRSWPGSGRITAHVPLHATLLYVWNTTEEQNKAKKVPLCSSYFLFLNQGQCNLFMFSLVLDWFLRRI